MTFFFRSLSVDSSISLSFAIILCFSTHGGWKGQGALLPVSKLEMKQERGACAREKGSNHFSKESPKEFLKLSLFSFSSPRQRLAGP